MTDDSNNPNKKLQTTITYLEMRAKPPRRELEPPAENLLIIRAEKPTVSFYRYLYNTVGGPWLWYERRQMRDEDLRAIIQNLKVEICVLDVNGVPAGYAELDLRQEPDIELAYFGIMPEFIGQGLGGSPQKRGATIRKGSGCILARWIIQKRSPFINRPVSCPIKWKKRLLMIRARRG